MTTLQKLDEGKVVMYFPEGKIVRGNEKVKAKPGIGYIQARSQKPVLPLSIRWDRTNSFPLPKLTMIFGKVISAPSSNSADIASYKKEAERILDAIYSLS